MGRFSKFPDRSVEGYDERDILVFHFNQKRREKRKGRSGGDANTIIEMRRVVEETVLRGSPTLEGGGRRGRWERGEGEINFLSFP
jgi:hypothetical protein